MLRNLRCRCYIVKVRRKIRFHEHPAVVARRNVAYVEAMAGREIPELRKNLPPLPQKRSRIVRPVDGKPVVPLEADVIRAVGQLLAVHPRVLYALRMNNGAASYETSSGKWAPVWFHLWVRSPEECRMVDFYGATKNGRIIALECKRESFTQPTDQREREQAAFLAVVRNAGGIGGFVRNADEAKALLDA